MKVQGDLVLLKCGGLERENEKILNHGSTENAYQNIETLCKLANFVKNIMYDFR